MSLYQKVTAANALEKLAIRQADEKSYHDAKVAHYRGLARSARKHSSIAEAVALDRMADKHAILAIG